MSERSFKPEEEQIFSRVEVTDHARKEIQLEFSTPELIEGTLDWLKRAEGLRSFIPETSFELQDDGTYMVIQDRVEGETLSLGDNGKVEQPLDDKDRKELATIIHECVSIYLETYDKEAKSGMSMEFEKDDSYIKGRNLAVGDEQDHLYLVDVYPALPRFKDELQHQIQVAGQRFGLEKEVIDAELDRLGGIEQYAKAA